MKVQREAQNLLLLGGSIGNFFLSLGRSRTNQEAGARGGQDSKTPQIRSTKEFQENQNPPHQESLVTQNLAKPWTVGKQRAKPQTQARLEYLDAFLTEDSDHPKTMQGGTT